MNLSVLLLLSAGLASANKDAYRIVREKIPPMSRQAVEAEEDKVSFDGSLQVLFEEAKNKKDSATDPPVPVAPLTSAPVPRTPAPVSAAPVTSAPVTQTPASVIQGTAAPITKAPITSEPVSSAPVTSAPTKPAPTVAPTTLGPVTFAPVTDVPAVPETSAPVTFLPADPTGSPVTTAPVTIVPSSTLGLSAYPTPTKSSTFLMCDGISFESVDAIDYRFAMEYESSYDVDEVLASLEQDMNEQIAQKLMACSGVGIDKDAEGVVRRKLQEDIGLVAIDSRDPDRIASSAFCGATFDTNTCKVVDGQMRIFIAPNVDPALVSYKVRVEVMNYLNSINDLPGLYATTYLSPEVINPTLSNTEGAGSDAPGFTATPENEQLSSRSITLFAFAGVAFIGSVGIAVWFRRNHERRRDNLEQVIKDDPPPLPPINTMDSGGDDTESLSPFSKMLPAAYRLDGAPEDMSIILELSETNSIRDGSSIMVSEGYSTDSEDLLESSDLNNSRYSYTQAPTLGAVKRAEEDTLVDV